MKILAIRGKNLASLAGEFEVDFQQEPLASAGLFAISGPTGAGKSTLLDALCLALYDATPRLLNAGSRGIALPDVRDERVTPQDSRTLLRRGTAEGYAEVDFVGSDGAAYRARWGVRRSRIKIDGALQAVSMSLNSLADMQPIGVTNREVKIETEKRIGLSFEQFTRAVLLPQNEFAAFLKADENERGALLETLTGSTLYSTISRRAFERARLEQAALQQLNDRFADQKPLTDEVRAQLDLDHRNAGHTIDQLEQRKSHLEQRLRWHQDWLKLQQHEQAARMDWQTRSEVEQAAAQRRHELTELESVQAARPFLHEADRLARDIAASHEKISTGEAELAAATLAREAADATCQSAVLTLQAAEQASSAAAPQLDAAKALDARIDAITPAHRSAEKAGGDSRRAASTAQAALAAKEDERVKTIAEQKSIDDWITQNRHLQLLAESWPRWDTLFKQAGETAQVHTRHGHQLAALMKDEAHKRQLDADAAARFQAAASALQEADIKRTQAAETLSGLDPQALPARRLAAEARRDLLVSAEKAWTGLAGNLARHQQQEEKSQHLQQAIAQTETGLEQAQQKKAGFSAALEQAERSLKRAEAACGETVESLRAALEEGEHCPVCGALDHPYRVDNPQLRATLAILQEEVNRCRQQLQQNTGQHAAQTAHSENNRTQLAAVAQELAVLATLIQSARQAWDTLVLAIEKNADLSGMASIAPDERAPWFTGQQQTVQELLRDISQQESIWRLATSAKDQAQKEYDASLAQHASIKEASTTATAHLTQASAESKALAEKCNSAGAQLDTQLADLAVVLDLQPSHEASAWHTLWRKEPEAFHARCRSEAEQWQMQCQARDKHQTHIGTIGVEHKALAGIFAKAQAEAARAAAAFNESETQIRAMQAERLTLFEGKPLRQVELDFRNTIEAAKTRLAEQTEAAKLHAASQTRCAEALAQARANLASQIHTAEAAGRQLDAWLGAFNIRHDSGHPGAATLLDLGRLRALLVHTADWINSERMQLQAITSAAASAAAIMKERQTQRELHELSRPALETVEEGDDAATIQSALDTLATERRAANDTASVIQVSIAQDNTRRQQSAALVTLIDQQAAVHHRWATLSDLIGSADGKKFRNYAQQFTLDVLLGYANRHLHELSRRYRLERVSETLALMVLDQDMGDEARSVHSLSGGESFLVSLALALGLASLSSNRVRVESLFIDEGFGSLDSDTLRVAMEALDGLQAMGRKVGVISHVQEMTERIGAKILVQRMAGGRSSLALVQA
ncbi:MAG: AAA family ATPase [Pseudomonadota bacterium]